MTSRLPRKQRKALYNLPLHRRRKMVRAHLAREYIDDPKVRYPRSAPVHKGDMVRIVRGDDAGTEAKVAEVDTRGYRIVLEGVTVATAKGQQRPKPIHPSNVVITKLDLTDPLRRRRLERGGEA